LQTGRRRNLSGYSFFLAPSSAGGPRLGILISRKHAVLAVDRNRIKRCIREAFRLEQDRIGALDVLVRPPYGIHPSRDMVNELRGLLCRLSG